MSGLGLEQIVSLPRQSREFVFHVERDSPRKRYYDYAHGFPRGTNEGVCDRGVYAYLALDMCQARPFFVLASCLCIDP